MSKANGKRYKNFDAFFKEQVRTPLVFTMFKKDWKMPPSMPAGLMVRLIRSNKDDTLDESAILEVCNDLLGEKQFAELCRMGLDIEQMESLIKWSTEEYGGKNLDEENKEISEEGNFQKEK